MWWRVPEQTDTLVVHPCREQIMLKAFILAAAKKKSNPVHVWTTRYHTTLQKQQEKRRGNTRDQIHPVRRKLLVSADG